MPPIKKSAGKERFVILPKRHVGVHARAVITEERLRHEGDGLVVPARYIANDVFVILHLVAHRLEGRETNINLCLTGGCDLVMLALNRDSGPLQFEAHFVADVLQGISRRDREITFLCADFISKVRRFISIAVPMAFATLYAMK
jgi:hypothetical protein